MRPLALSHCRFLLCASAAHCAQVLHAAAAARVNLHGLQPCTQWPSTAPANGLLLWTLIPSTNPAEAAQEQQWRAQALHAPSIFTIQMLYGSAAQQAVQLAPWMQGSDPTSSHSDTHCWECLDAASEQKLFQHLLQNRSPS